MKFNLLTILLLCLALSGCKVKQLQTQGTSEVRLVAHEELTDSTRHRYKLEVITLYNEVGGVERTEERAEGDILHRTRYVRDTTFIHVVDTLYLAKGDSAPLDSSVVEAKKDLNSTSRLWAITIIAVVIVVAVVILSRYFPSIRMKS